MKIADRQNQILICGVALPIVISPYDPFFLFLEGAKIEGMDSHEEKGR
jgi:hypothetical protein